MKATAVAPSNIAFIKYWGKKDEKLRLPSNGSISMNLGNLLTTTTVEFSKKLPSDTFQLLDKNKRTLESVSSERVKKHLDKIRQPAKLKLKAKVVSHNNFPSSTGLSSSASGFAALTLAGTEAAGLKMAQKELTILARQGSGSACRSMPDGFVEWLDAETSEGSYAHSLHPSDWWELADVVAITSRREKEVSSTEGQQRISTSSFYNTRQELITNKLEKCKKLLKNKSFTEFGELIEAEALELHAIMLTSRPSLIYWQKGTLAVIKAIKKWRKEGLESYFTINTGQDVHLICRQKDEKKLQKKLSQLSEVKKTITNHPASGASLSDQHLF